MFGFGVLLRNKVTLFILIVFFLWPCTIFATPSITGISGTVSDGEQIIISGSGFGSTGPTIYVFDDFEKGNDGDPISTSANGATVNRWYDTASPYPRYSNSYAHSGSLSSRSNWEDNGASEGARWIGLSGTQFTTIYLSYWGFIPTGKDIPGTNPGTPGGPNFKYWWVYKEIIENIWYDDYSSATGSNFTINPGGWYPVTPVNDNGPPSRIGLGYGASSTEFVRNRWVRWEVYIIGDATNGYIQQWEMASSKARYSQGSDSGRTLRDDDYFYRVHFPGYGRGDTNSMSYYDDIYVAIGDQALARVEIGNENTYTSCTNLAVATVDSWASGQITATVRQGSFSDQDPAYLYVLDENGTPNSIGYSITIGEGSTQKTISNLSIHGGGGIELH